MNIRTTLIPTFLVVLSSLCTSASLLAQEDGGESRRTRQGILLEERRNKARDLTPYRVSEGEARVLGLERIRFPQNIFIKGFHGVRPLVGGMPSGSGLVGGVGYIRGLDSEWFRLTADARFSTRNYKTFDIEARFPTRHSRLPIRAHVRAGYEDLKSLGFFGLGNGSREDDRSFFRQENTTFGAGLTARAGRLLELGAEGSRLRVESQAGSRDPSLETLFDIDRPAGFGTDATDFDVYGGHVGLHLLDGESPAAGVSLRVEANRYDDRDFELFDFTRVVGEVQAHVPLGPRNRILALRLRTSHSSADFGQEVPFFLMETVGGARTLRGYREYRFRGTRNLLLNAEYRWEVWNYVDFALFFDAGKVFSDPDDLDFTDMHTGYGFGIRGHWPGDFVLRLDFARSREGFRFHIGAGPSF